MHVYETRRINDWEGWQEISLPAWHAARGSYPTTFTPTKLTAYFLEVARAAAAVAKAGHELYDVNQVYINWLPTPGGGSAVIAFDCAYQERTFFVACYHMPWLDLPAYSPLPPRARRGRKRASVEA